VRFLPVSHTGHRTAAPDEAEVVQAEIERLVDTPYAEHGSERSLRYDDFIVVAPYNSHVRCLREKLPAAVRVGTVDKFQGQTRNCSIRPHVDEVNINDTGSPDGTHRLLERLAALDDLDVGGSLGESHERRSGSPA
jgi:hypothetical protein